MENIKRKINKVKTYITDYLKDELNKFTEYIKNFEHADLLPLLLKVSKWTTIILIILKILGIISISLLSCFLPIFVGLIILVLIVFSELG